MWKVLPCDFGSGVFATEDIPPLTYIGTYLGKQISREKYKQKKQALSRYTDYCAEVPDNPNFLYDPTDDTGELSKEYINNTPLYINEPPPGYLNNCCWVFNKTNNFEETTNLEIWTFREIRKGEQFFIFYGNDYAREYIINRDNNACGLPNHFNFSVKSQKTDTIDERQFIIDEHPAWMCDIINNNNGDNNNNNNGEKENTKSMMEIWKDGQKAQQMKNNPILLIDNCKDTTLIPFLRVLDTIIKQQKRV